MGKLVIIAVLSAILCDVWSENQYGLTLDESKWASTSSPLECCLTQDLPQYGQVNFTKLAGYGVQLKITRWTVGDEAGAAILLKLPPPWRHSWVAEEKGTIEMHTGRVPFVLSPEHSRELLNWLGAGWFAGIRYQRPKGEAVLVTISPVDFHKAYVDYLKCVNEQLPFKMEEIQSMVIHFKSDSLQINDEGIGQLDKLIEFNKRTIPYRKIILKGFSDSVGREDQNMRLSVERATAVKNHLVAGGIPNSKIQMSAYGEEQPVASNLTATGRYQNRRVTMELLH